MLSGCTLQIVEPVAPYLPSAPESIHVGITQTGHGSEARFRLCADCPVPTRKVLAPVPPPIRLVELTKAKPILAPAPKAEPITRRVFFPFASSSLTAKARRELNALQPQLLEAKSIHLTGYTDRVGVPTFNRKLATRRTETVRQALLDLGVPADRIAPVEARCCVDDPPRINPSARRTDLDILIVRPAP
jgi:hypothetical protein